VDYGIGEIEELIANWFPRIETPAQGAAATTTFVPEQNRGSSSELVPERNHLRSAHASGGAVDRACIRRSARNRARPALGRDLSKD